MKSPFNLLRPGASGALPRLLFALLLAAAAAAPAAARGDKDWKPVDPSDLARAAATVEKDADAEALFWEVFIDDSKPFELSLKHYVRIKVFNERGRDSQSKVELPYFGGYRINDVAARVIQPAGSVVELKKEDVFERTAVRVSGLKVKVKSFALPGVEPGSIIEYRWREVRPGGSADTLRLQFQRDIPVRSVTYYLRPYRGMRCISFNMREPKFEKAEGGFTSISAANMPAFREEPRMPPEDSVRSWAFLYYSEGERAAPEAYWKEVGRRFYAALKDEMKAGDEVRAAAAAAVGDARTPDEKLQRLYDFCRTKIKNVNDDASGLTADERQKLKENKSPADTLKRGSGTGSDIDFLFAALASAAGFEARLALTGNNSDMFFDRALTHSSFLGSTFIAVRVGDGWRFFSPAETYTSYGMLSWVEEGQDVLVTDPKEPVWARSPVAPAERSAARRAGKFRLLEDGTLEGEVRMEYTGHLAYEKKEYNDDDSPAEREKTLQDAFKSQMGAEVTDIRFENVTDPVKPLVCSFRVRVPGYAQRTGKRLFIQPAFFQKGLAAGFPTASRRHEVYFHHAWSEDDKIEIELPEGFALDNADSPAPFGATGLSEYEPKTGVTKDGRTLVYTRRFAFGRGGDQPLRFQVYNYSILKDYFDQVSRGDGHTIALKQSATAAK
ncbi:MAG TPA: DUF3857 domain-containing protein [Pyrinomonadaceae bacterium]|jgi:hypothetical protein